LTHRLLAILESHELDGKPLPDGRQVADLVSETLIREALKGKPYALTLLFNRLEEKAVQPLGAVGSGESVSIVFYIPDNGRDGPLASGSGQCEAEGQPDALVGEGRDRSLLPPAELR
jgi:hypothetical protein